MRAAIRWLTLVGVLFVAAIALADPPKTIKVVVGRSTPLSLGFHATMHVCDDPSIVRIDLSPDKKGWVAVGLKEGKTLCGFSETAESTRQVYELKVYGAGASGDVK